MFRANHLYLGRSYLDGPFVGGPEAIKEAQEGHIYHISHKACQSPWNVLWTDTSARVLSRYPHLSQRRAASLPSARSATFLNTDGFFFSVLRCFCNSTVALLLAEDNEATETYELGYAAGDTAASNIIEVTLVTRARKFRHTLIH